MTEGGDKPDRPMVWLGRYASLALTLPACVAAGYMIGLGAQHLLGWPILPAVGIFLGMAGGIIQILRELQRENKSK